jgi:GTP-binding protein EngB required for normal cell division
MNARTVTTSVGPADFTALLQRARQWATQASAAGFLDEADLARFAAVEAGPPADLFCDQQARPLVVAFFGGTGVGKSSLLNRLAGAAIARTGVERPNVARSHRLRP